MTAVGKKFPNISVNAIDSMGDTFKMNVLQEAVKDKKKVLLFWYPKDFTFVCPTELHAFQMALGEFEKRNTKVIAASCDTAEVHFAWLNTDRNNGGIEGVTYPILADTNRNLANALGITDVISEEFDDETGHLMVEGENITFRATYLLDEEGMVFHESVNFFPVGRNVKEYLRMIDAFTHVQEKGEVCPANWEEGKTAMKADTKGVAEYLAAHH